MKVAIGSIIRNRAWILPEYLHALETMEHDDTKEYIFLENDSEDVTLKFLQFFKDHSKEEVNVQSINTGELGWDRHGDATYRDDQFKNIAYLRNELINLFLEWSDAEYLFSVDSDVIVQPDTLKKLIAVAEQHPGEIIGAAISNEPGKPLDGLVAGNFMIMQNVDTLQEGIIQQGLIYHPCPYTLSGIMDVFVVGAVYLIPRAAFEAGVRYGPDPQGEDIYFCREAEQLGFPRKVVLDAQCEHRMKRSSE